MPTCGSEFKGYHRDETKSRRDATRGWLCPASYSDEGGFQSCRGRRKLGKCPKGFNFKEGD